MKTFRPGSYAIANLYDWYKQSPSQITLNPKFQRHAVWSTLAKSYLINTVLQGLPLPIFFIRNCTDTQTKKIAREVIDGQQRLRAIFNFIDNGFPLEKVQNEQYGGLYFSQLPDAIQYDILSYELTVNELEGIDDKDVLDIFARLNSYGVKLNNQELLNVKYFGYFKQLAYSLGFTFAKFWERNKLFSNANIMRMKETEFVSDLLVSMLDGVQDIKSLDKYYQIYDERFDEREVLEARFKETIDYFTNLYDGDFSNTRYSSPITFYAVYVILYHQNYGVKDFKYPRRVLAEADKAKIRMAFDEIENVLEKTENLSSDEQAFLISCKKPAGSKAAKITRCGFMASVVNKYLGIE
jgi:hypothetical protein